MIYKIDKTKLAKCYNNYFCNYIFFNDTIVEPPLVDKYPHLHHKINYSTDQKGYKVCIFWIYERI